MLSGGPRRSGAVGAVGLVGFGMPIRHRGYLAGQSGVAFTASAQARGCVVTTILILTVGTAVIAGLFWAMMRMERSHRRRMERHREVWRAAGSVGLEPGKWGGNSSGGGGSVNFGGGG